jgi:hypothetical protein
MGISKDEISEGGILMKRGEDRFKPASLIHFGSVEAF